MIKFQLRICGNSSYNSYFFLVSLLVMEVHDNDNSGLFGPQAQPEEDKAPYSFFYEVAWFT